MMTLKEALELCKKNLKRCNIETYLSDCIFLVAHLQGVEPSLLPLKEKEPFKQPERLKELLNRRCKERISVAHLLGEWDCMGRTFKVFPKVLAPRPATELLVETTIHLLEEKFGKEKPIKGLEIGTGTGCISVNLLLEFPNLQMVGVEIDPVAVENTLENAHLYKVNERLKLLKGDIFKLCPQIEEKFDFIVSNPPYIAEEDKNKLPPEVLNENPLALFGGKGGIKFHKFFAEHCKRVLKPFGFMVLEFEPFQREVLENFFTSKGWKVQFVNDFAGSPRILIANKGNEN